MRISERITKGWNAFMNKDPTYYPADSIVSSYNAGAVRFARGNDQSIIDAIYNRIAMDCAQIKIRHCYMDDNGYYKDEVKGPINTCLSLRPNIDQGSRQFFQDVVMSMLDWGHACVVPVQTDDEDDPNIIETYQKSIPVTEMRVGKVVAWATNDVKINLYNSRTGKHDEIWMAKEAVCIIQNPFYDVMNRPNSSVLRLKNKLKLSDIIDEQSTSNKFNMIIQMPYTIKTPGKKQQAEERVKSLQEQLATSKYGIGYIDATEHITQLNRALDNHILESIEYYQKLVYDQFGITPEVMNGTADDAVMNNYLTRTIEPIVSAICEEMKYKFLSKTARSQKQSIEFFMDPFKLVPVSQLPDFVDKFTRNAVLTSNECRQIVGKKPSDDPRADELRNKNISESKDEEHIDLEGNVIKDNEADATQPSKKKEIRRKNQNEKQM